MEMVVCDKMGFLVCQNGGWNIVISDGIAIPAVLRPFCGAPLLRLRFLRRGRLPSRPGGRVVSRLRSGRLLCRLRSCCLVLCISLGCSECCVCDPHRTPTSPAHQIVNTENLYEHMIRMWQFWNIIERILRTDLDLDIVDRSRNIRRSPHKIPMPTQMQNLSLLLRTRIISLQCSTFTNMQLLNQELGPNSCRDTVQFRAHVPGRPKLFRMRKQLLNSHRRIRQNLSPALDREIVNVSSGAPTSGEVQGIDKLRFDVEEVAPDSLPLVVRHACHILEVEEGRALYVFL